MDKTPDKDLSSKLIEIRDSIDSIDDQILELLSNRAACAEKVAEIKRESGEKELVLVGADAQEDDMTGLVADLSLPCPGLCGTANVLNS